MDSYLGPVMSDYISLDFNGSIFRHKLSNFILHFWILGNLKCNTELPSLGLKIESLKSNKMQSDLRIYLLVPFTSSDLSVSDVSQMTE